MTKLEQEAIHDALAQIAKENGGRLTPDDVVAAARAKDSPLHGQFEWDGKVAAQAWRIEQARCLIRSVRVVITNERTTVSTVCYVRDPDAEDGEQGYVATVTLVGDTERARATLVNEFSRAGAALRRAKELAEVFNMVGEVEAVTESVDRLVTRVSASVEQMEPA